jgi:alpha-glucosidase
MNKIRALLLSALYLFIAAECFADDAVAVNSPDGKVRLRVFVSQNKLLYSVSFRDKPVIEASPLAMTVDQVPITTGVQFTKTEKYKINETYPWYGVHAQAQNKLNGTKVTFRTGKEKINYTLDLRVFNDGAAFRLIVPGTATASRIPDETTIFKVPAGGTVWYHDLEMHYESVHINKEISQIKSGEWLAPPATIKLPQNNGYAIISEANLQNYSGMALKADGNRGLALKLAYAQPTSYPYLLRYSPEDTLRLSKPAAVTGTITTPWRVVIVAADLNGLVNSDVIANLNPAPDKKLFPEGIKTDWLRPGRAVWKYLDGGGESTLATMKEFSRQAGELGFEHNILEGFWSRWTNEEIQELVNYSKERNVGIWLWKHSKTLRDEKERLAFFDRCQQLGVVGVKLDFFDHEAKEVIDLYQNILRETVERKLMVDFHGANKPTGEARTWRNEVTREAIKGMEASKLLDRATHNATVPFTRFVAGQAEYTPVHFGDRRKNTTWAHQIATAAIMASPLLTYAASPANLLANPGVEMIKSIPSYWDETIVLLPSKIGEVAAFARRKGSTWFIAVTNGLKPISLKISLSFLGSGTYKTLIVADDGQQTDKVKINNQSLKKGDVLEMNLGEGGGYIARFIPGNSSWGNN